MVRTLMNKSQLELFQEFERLLPPKWFKLLRQSQGPLYPLVWGLCGALAEVRASIMAVHQQAIPESSEGFWLSLHLLGLGIQRTTETDAQAHARYRLEFEHTRNTRAGMRRFIEALSGLPTDALRIETDFELNRYGSVRLVLNADLSYRDVGWNWVARLLTDHVANGLRPSVDIELQDLTARPLVPWRFDHPFPLGEHQLGPMWERPAMTDPLRLIEVSRNQFAFLRADEWELLTLGRIFRDTHLNGAPGAKFAYLTTDGRCYALDYQPETIEIKTDDYGARPFRVDGFTFQDVFPRAGNQSITETVEIDIRIYGLSPDDSNLFCASNEPLQAFSEPSGHTLPSAETWRLLTVNAAFAHDGIPREWAIASRIFGQLYRFPYEQQWEQGSETITRQIADILLLPYAIPGGFVTETVETWRKRGNAWEQTQFCEGNHSLPLATDWDLLEPANISEPHSFQGEPAKLASHFRRFGQQYKFATMADPAVWVTGDVWNEPETAYIPNVRAGWTRGLIIEWYEVLLTLEEQQTPDSLVQLGNGPWVLRLGSGNPSWGAIVPGGIAPLQGEFARLSPAGQWWSDADHLRRSATPILDADGVAYLFLEFLLPKGTERRLRELELRIGYEYPGFEYTDGWSVPTADGWILADADSISIPTFDDDTRVLNLKRPVLDIVHYRRLDLLIDRDTNWGIIFCIATRLRDVQTQLLPAFRTGQSGAGEVLRDRDYVYVI